MLPTMSYPWNFGSCFIFNLRKFKSKYCFKTILHEEESHFLFLFLLKHNLKCAKMIQKRFLKGTSLLKQWQSRNGVLQIRH